MPVSLEEHWTGRNAKGKIQDAKGTPGHLHFAFCILN